MFAVGLEGPVIPSEELRLEPKRAPLRHVATDGLDSDSRLTTTTSLESPLQGDLIHSSAYGGCDWILVNQSLVRLHWRQHWRQHWLWKTHCTTEEMVNQGTMTSMIISGSVQVITIHIIYNYIYIYYNIYIYTTNQGEGYLGAIIPSTHQVSSVSRYYQYTYLDCARQT